MSAINKPSIWILLPALATSFWVTFAVLAAAPGAPDSSAVGGPSAALQSGFPEEEVVDPALASLVARFASVPSGDVAGGP